MNKYEYKVETKPNFMVNDLEDYLNTKANEGWRCVSVVANTGLGLTITIVFERKVVEN